MIGYVYRTTNTQTGAIYVGQHLGAFDHRYLGSGIVLIKAVRKYSRRAFTVEILEYAETQEQLDRMEKEFIKAHREAGVELYNIAEGGRRGRTNRWLAGPDHPNFGRRFGPEARANMARAAKTRIRPSDEARANMSASQRGSTRPPFSEEHRRKLGEAMKKRCGPLHPFFGKTHTAEVRRRIAESNRRRAQNQNTEIPCHS